MLGRISLFFYGASLVTLPMVGVGVLALATGRDWGFGLQPSWVFLYLALACSLADVRPRHLSGARDFIRSHRGLLGAIALTLAVVALSGLGIVLAPSGEPAASAWSRFGRQVVQLMIMSGFTLWPAVWTRGQRRWRFTLKMLLIGGLVQLGYGLMQQIHYYHPGFLLPALERIFTSNPAILSGSEELYLGDTFKNVPRLRGTMCEPLYLGNYLLFVIPLLVWGRRWWPRTRGLLVALCVLLFLTWSRGAWLGFLFQVVALMALVLLRRRSEKARWNFPSPGPLVLVGGGLSLLALVAGFLFSDWAVFQFPRDRLIQTFSNQDWSNLTRIFSMQAGWRAFLLSPVVGVGWGQFAYQFPLLVDPLGLQSQFSWPVVNNFPLEILCETGAVGFLVFLFLAWRLVRSSLGQVRIDPRRRAVAVGAAFLGVAGVWFQLLTFSQYNLPHIWVGLGLLLAALEDGGLSHTDLPSETSSP